IGVFFEIIAANANFTSRWKKQRSQNFEQRRLPRTVGPEQAKRLTRSDAQINLGENGPRCSVAPDQAEQTWRGERLAQMSSGNSRGCHCSPTARTSSRTLRWTSGSERKSRGSDNRFTGMRVAIAAY